MAFEEFGSSSTSLFTVTLMHVFNTLFYSLMKFSQLHYRVSPLTIGTFVFGIFNPVILGWIIIIFRMLNKGSYGTAFKSSYYNRFLINMDSFYALGVSITYSLCVVTAVHNGQCKGIETGDDDFYSGFGCTEELPNRMPNALMMAAAVVPIFITVAMKGAKWEAIVSSFLICEGCMIYSIFAYNKTGSLSNFLFFLPICLLVLWEYQRQNIFLFLLAQNQENLLLENERLADETHANELRSMIGNVAHDLKTPLSAFVSGMDIIISILSEIQSASTANTEIGRGLRSILESVHNMKNVNEFMLMTINRCIDYTKASQGLKLVPRMETINFVDAINLPLSCMKDLQQDKKIEIKLLPIIVDISECVITDKQWLQENILCLLSNAVKYSVSGGVTIKVTLQGTTGSRHSVSIRTESSDVTDDHSYPMIRIEIEDSGIGVDDEAVCTLFSPFKQAQRLAGGTGLGLYSLARRMEALGGTYGVSPRRDGESGSIFWFAIPYRPDDNTCTSPQTVTPTRTPSISVSGITQLLIAPSPNIKYADSELNILLVDDSLSILKMTTMMLKRQGHTLQTAENGAIALDLITSAIVSNNPYDVVLMDLQMPVMDGLEATTRLRKIESNVDKTIVSTRNNSKEQVISEQNHKTALTRLSLCENGIPQSDFVTAFSHQLIIGVSANSDNDTMEAAFKAGIDAFIPKPFNMQNFKDTYNNLLQKRHNEQKNKR